MKMNMAKFQFDDKTPEEMLVGEFKPLADIKGKKITIFKYAFYTSDNTSKYNDETKHAVYMLYKIDGDDSYYRTPSHSQTIIKAFKNMEKAGVTIPEEGMEAMISDVQTKNGRTATSFVDF